MQKKTNDGVNENAKNTVDTEFSLYDKSGRQKSLGFAVAATVVGILSLLLCAFGWTGIIFGISAIVFAVIARIKIGYFNVLIIIGIVTGIFGTVLGVFFCAFYALLPEIKKWLEGISFIAPNTENV